MSATTRVLVVDPTSEILTRHSGLLKDSDSGVIAETVATIAEALARLEKAGYDTIVCRVDQPEETSLLVRLRKAAPWAPIVAVTPRPNPALEDLARESGADQVQSEVDEVGGSGRKMAARIRRLITVTRAARSRAQEVRAQTRELVAEHRRLVTRQRIFSAQRIEAIVQSLHRFVPLIVEDSADQAFLMKRAFQKAGLPCPLPVLRDGKEAIDYMDGEPPFDDRKRHPLPTLVLLDVKLPKRSGLDVLSWMRSVPELSRVPVYMLTSSSLEFDRVMALGATDYFTKPMSFEGLIDTIRNITVRWWFYEQARAFSVRLRTDP
jgi:DNA-binding response OmpR family regulator